MGIEEEVWDLASANLKKVKKSGNENLVAICPFHRKANGEEERNPAFTMSLSKGVWFCFACHERGNLRTFLRRFGVGTGEIEYRYSGLINALAKNIDKPFNTLRPQGIWDGGEVQETILGVFEKCPMALVDQGFKESLLRSMDIGYDTKHDRITFPLRDVSGRLVGISGRNMSSGFGGRYTIYEKEYKAFGYPEHKTERSALLWNCHNVYPGIFLGNEKNLVLVEGFKACLWVLQAGIKNCVALLGSYMSKQQHWLLERMGARVHLMFDNDQAGQNCTDRISETLSKSLDVSIVQYPAEQPDALTASQVITAVKASTDYYVWYSNRRRSQWHSGKIPQ